VGLRAGPFKICMLGAFAHRLVTRCVDRSIGWFRFGGHSVAPENENHPPRSRSAGLSLPCRADEIARLKKGQACPLRLGLALKVDSLPAPWLRAGWKLVRFAGSVASWIIENS
jgi:hypothetical protein